MLSFVRPVAELMSLSLFVGGVLALASVVGAS